MHIPPRADEYKDPMTRSLDQWCRLYISRRIRLCCAIALLAVAGAIWSFFQYFDMPRITAKKIEARELSHIVILYRHAERCDRSDSQCLGNLAGITVRGGRKAAQLGEQMRQLFSSDYSLMSSNTLRTQQSASSFAGVMPVIVNKELDSNECTLQTFPAFINAVIHNPAHKMQIVFTHSECLEFFAAHFGHKTMTAKYLDNLVLDIDRHHHVKVLGTLALDH